MNPAFAALALAPGLAVGSFLNVVAARVPLHRSLVRPGSACMSCSKAIAWRDNIPVVSFLLLRGRCRHCGARIGLVYPAVELASALLVAGCVLAFGLSLRGLIAAFFCCVLVAISAVDLAHRIVPDRIVLPATVLVLAAQTVREPSLWWPLCALGASLFLFLAVLAYPAGMGMGDVKLALLMGAALGKLVSVALMVGMLAALVPGIYLMARHGSAARKMGIPFAPFLALGSIVALFAGNTLLHAYLGLLGA
jgi:leader peptidase (prepilin peptidase)/N-methyltransferase